MSAYVTDWHNLLLYMALCTILLIPINVINYIIYLEKLWSVLVKFIKLVKHPDQWNPSLLFCTKQCSTCYVFSIVLSSLLCIAGSCMSLCTMSVLIFFLHYSEQHCHVFTVLLSPLFCATFCTELPVLSTLPCLRLSILNYLPILHCCLYCSLQNCLYCLCYIVGTVLYRIVCHVYTVLLTTNVVFVLCNIVSAAQIYQTCVHTGVVSPLSRIQEYLSVGMSDGF